MSAKSYNRSVFVNCPLDDDYTPLFRAIVFSVLKCKHYVRCAAEEDDASEVRLHKILRMIGESRLSIHDLSRTKLSGRTRLPRFNMPFELGLFLAAKHFGQGDHSRKVCLVFEQKAHSYEAMISDIKGQDVVAHHNDARRLVIKIRDWLAANSMRTRLPGGHAVWANYQRFNQWLPTRCREIELVETTLTLGDLVNLVYEWMEQKDVAM